MLISKRLILEEIDPKNIEQLRQWRNDPSLRRYFREYRDISKDMQSKWYSGRGNNSDPEHIYFQIMERKLDSNGEPIGLERDLIGCCNLGYINYRLRSAEFGIYLAGSQGKGFGKESLTMLLNFAFSDVNMHIVRAECYDFNNAIRLYRDGLGMKVDGKIRHSQFVEGEYVDSIMLSVTENEWFQKNKKGVQNEPTPWR
jgi:RimJ/RimL family protein N-acetyltransferase